MPELKASVIIPTHNRAPILSHCLNYLSHQTTKDYEIIVIDDASCDSTTEQIALCQSRMPNLKYIKLNNRVGPYVARNIGIKEAKGEIIVFLDSDVIVHTRFVQDHIQIHDRKANIYVQGMVKHIRSMGQVNFRFYYPNALCVGTFITQNVSVKKEWIDRIGGFEEFGSKIGYKDVDMGLRLRQIGIRGVHAILKCKAYHIDGNPANANLQDYFLKHQERGLNAVFFLDRHGKLGERFAHPRKAVYIARLFQTDKWAEKGFKFLIATRDSPILPLFPICKALIKYHYRAKGVLEAQSKKAL